MRIGDRHVRPLIATLAFAATFAFMTSFAKADVIFLASFDGASGDTVKDVVGGAVGTVIGTPNYIAGKFGDAFDFDGATAIQFEKTDTLAAITEPMTVGAWVNPASLSGWTNIIEMDGVAGAWKFGFRDAAPVWTTYFVKDHIGNGPVDVGAWSHVVATYDGAKARLYVNGVLDAEIDGAGAIDVSVPDIPTLDIGWRSTSQSSFFVGAMDEVFIADTALSEGEIADAMNGLANAAAVEAQGKLATQWGILKAR